MKIAHCLAARSTHVQFYKRRSLVVSVILMFINYNSNPRAFQETLLWVRERSGMWGRACVEPLNFCWFRSVLRGPERNRRKTNENHPTATDRPPHERDWTICSVESRGEKVKESHLVLSPTKGGFPRQLVCSSTMYPAFKFVLSMSLWIVPEVPCLSLKWVSEQPKEFAETWIMIVKHAFLIIY